MNKHVIVKLVRTVTLFPAVNGCQNWSKCPPTRPEGLRLVAPSDICSSADMKTYISLLISKGGRHEDDHLAGGNCWSFNWTPSTSGWSFARGVGWDGRLNLRDTHSRHPTAAEADKKIRIPRAPSMARLSRFQSSLRLGSWRFLKFQGTSFKF